MQISLTNRNLADFDASAFSTKEEREMLYKISKLDVSHNRLTVVKGMQCLTNLTSLDVSCNLIRSLSGLPLKIRRLNVSQNDLKSLEGLAALTQLEWIDCSKNDLGSLIGLPATQSLRHVEASHNKLPSVKGVELTPSLHFLGIASNVIRKVEDIQPLKNLRALKGLDITNNPITTTGRNTAAIRMCVPKITMIEGIVAVNNGTNAVLANTIDFNDPANISYRMQHNLKETSQINGRVGANMSMTASSAARRSSSAGPVSGTTRGRSPSSGGGAPSSGPGGAPLRRSSSADRSVNINVSGAARPISPIGRRQSNDVTPNTSTVTINGLSAGAARNLNNTTSFGAFTNHNQQKGSTGSSSHQLNVGGPALKGAQSTYEVLLRDLEMSKTRALRSGVIDGDGKFVAPTGKSTASRGQSPAGQNSSAARRRSGSSSSNNNGLNITHIPSSAMVASSSRNANNASSLSTSSAAAAPLDKHARSRSADELRRNTLTKAQHIDGHVPSMRTGIIPHKCPETQMERDARISAAVENSYNGRAPTLVSSSSGNGRDGTFEKDLLNASQPSIELHRTMEQRIAQLEKDLAFTKRRLEDKTVECDNAQLQVKQLKETIDRQARVNAVLADTNRSLSVTAVHMNQSSGAHLASASHSANRAVANNSAVRSHNGAGVGGEMMASSGMNRSSSASSRPHSKSPKRLNDSESDQQQRQPTTSSTARRPQSAASSSSPNRPRSGPRDGKNVAHDSQGYYYQQQNKQQSSSSHQMMNDNNSFGNPTGPSATVTGRTARDQENVHVASGYRAAAKEPKRNTMNSALQPSNYHQSMAPLGGGAGAGNSSGVVRNAYFDPHGGVGGSQRGGSGTARGSSSSRGHSYQSPQRSASANNSRNVSFGGSLFYSPPQHYNNQTP